MEILVQIIFISAIMKYCLKASLTRRFRTIFLYALFAGVWALILYPVVINQPVSIIGQLLANKKVVTEGAVLTTIEAIAGILISIRLLDNYFAPKEKRKKTLFVLKVMPGILFLLAVAYFELMFFKWRVAGNFLTTALMYAGLSFTTVLTLSCLIKMIAPGESLKLEMKLLLNLMILFTGLLINSSVADYNLSAAKSPVEWKAMFALIGLALFFFIIGIFAPKIKIRNFFKQ